MTDRQKDRVRQMKVDGCGYIKIAQELGILENTVKSFCSRKGLNGVAAAEFVHDDNVYCKYYEVFYILFHTVMRISEFCGLTLKDVDMKNRVIDINRQLQKTSWSEYVIKAAKTNAGTRKIPMTDDVYQMFQAIIQDRPTGLPEIIVQGYGGFLFGDKNEPQNPTVPYVAFGHFGYDEYLYPSWI